MDENRDSSTQGHLEDCRAGGREGFAALYERMAPPLHAWARLRIRGSLGRFVEPEDLVQEVWWRAMDAFPRFDGEQTSFRAWLFRIATNVLLEMNRKRRPRSPALPEGRADRMRSLPPELAVQATSIGRDLRVRESVNELVRLIRELDQDSQRILMHCGLEGLTARETATLVGKSPEAVAKSWQRLRDRLESHPSVTAML
jgi:RNA polymerase sigma-70 factor (ECF subfamily)